MNKANNNELDEQLKQLALLAQKHSALSQERRLALTKLVNGIVQSGRLCRPLQSQFLGIYNDIYDEAVQELLLYICQNIDKYAPSRGSVMAWVNVLLDRRFFKEAIPKVLEDKGIKKMSLSDLDNIARVEETQTLTEILKECIDLDPEGLFKKTYMENSPEVNFQALAKRRISGKSWKDISLEFNIKISTISGFYYRCLNRFSEKLKEYCTTL